MKLHVRFFAYGERRHASYRPVSHDPFTKGEKSGQNVLIIVKLSLTGKNAAGTICPFEIARSEKPSLK
ncbi:MAG: hypothetical protein C4516_01620 [Oxalobacter sp.]|nr:MAG: hypothetical protein C4516_01620 [Oxalobacter sp.]